MKMITNTGVIKLSSAAGLVLGMLFATSAYTQDIDALNAQYEADMRHCASSSVIDKEACKREAGAALSEAKKGNLTGASKDVRDNRCQYLHGVEKSDCEKLMHNPDAKIQGSVQSGGVIRSMEYEYTPEVNNSKTPSATGSNTDESVTKTYATQ